VVVDVGPPVVVGPLVVLVVGPPVVVGPLVVVDVGLLVVVTIPSIHDGSSHGRLSTILSIR